MDAPSTLSLKQGAVNMFDVDTAGAINLTAKVNQDINITATGSGQVNISGGVTVESAHSEVVNVPADGTVVVSGHKLISGVQFMGLSGGENGQALYTLARQAGGSMLIHTLSSIIGDVGELYVIDVDGGDFITVKFAADHSGTFTGATAVTLHFYG